MILMRILPGILKELSRHVPSVLFQAIEWKELAHEIPKISRRILQKEGYESFYHHQEGLFQELGIKLISDTPHTPGKNLDQDAAEKILKLYFSQLFSPYGLFLDLRATQFSKPEDSLLFQGSSFWTTFSDEFRHSLIEVYEGFYLNHEESYYSGLQGIGLIHADWSREDKISLGEIFKSQFGKNAGASMKFNLEHLNESIIELSHFMLSKKVKISKDFLYLGIYLVTLYSCLESLDKELQVKDVFLEVKNQFSKV